MKTCVASKTVMPFSREMRSAVYQRAKGQIDTLPFGTQRDVDRDGYEWMSHSMAPKPVPGPGVRPSTERP